VSRKRRDSDSAGGHICKPSPLVKVDHKFSDAVAAYKRGHRSKARLLLVRLLKADREHADALHLLGMILREDGHPDAAVTYFRRAIAINPTVAASHHNLGTALQDLGKLRDAEASYRQALALQPDHVAAKNNLGLVLGRLGYVDEALSLLRQALSINPRFAEAHNNLGFLLHQAGRYDEAVAQIQNAIALDPNQAEFHVNHADSLHRAGRERESAAAFDRSLVLRPRWPRALWGRLQALPILYESQDEIHEHRTQWQQRLAQFADLVRLDTPHAIREAIQAVTAYPNFYLHYQGQNDRSLQQEYGALLTRITKAAYPQYSVPRRPRLTNKSGRLRVGFVSAFFRHHSVAKSHGAWITELEQKYFEPYVYHLGTTTDHVTAKLRTAASRFHHLPGPVNEAIATIASDDLDFLIYLDIGMDPRIQAIAPLRLAPMQATTWGHPVTSGLPSIDFFLSSALMEPPDGNEHYTEQLVRLPNLSVCYVRPAIADVEAVDRRTANRADGPVFLCSQSLFKLLPQFDIVFPRIARELGRCRFWFIAAMGEHIGERFRLRLGKVFAAHGLEASNYVQIFPQLTQERFYALNQAADVLLDSFLWSGFNSTLEAIACGLPVVTCPGPTMRGRHSAACLWRMGMPQLVADDMDEYVAIAARLVTDKAWRAEVDKGVRDFGQRLFRDTTPIQALETFLGSSAMHVRQ